MCRRARPSLNMFYENAWPARLGMDAAAIEYARRIIEDLRKDPHPEDPEPTIVVKNTAGEVIYRFPAH